MAWFYAAKLAGFCSAVDNGLGFSLVAWTPTLEGHLGRQITGVASTSSVDWSFARKRGLGIS